MIDRSNTDESTDVLLVEPADEFARLARDGFSGNRPKTTVHTVSDGTDALDFLAQRGAYTDVPTPSLIVFRLDCSESESDGLTALEELTSEPALARIPVVVMADSPSEETVQEAYRPSVNAVVSTPTDPDAFLETMDLIAQFWIATARLPNRTDRF